MLIRQALIEDAASACETMRRSIAELCGADHHDDPEILRPWLANKTPHHWAAWLAYEANTVLVAVDDETVLAVGVVRNDGEITCNYISPDARFRGVSKAMLAQLEATARALGNASCKLESTETARRFYLACGYEQVGLPQGKFGTTGAYPMLKRFAADPVANF
jgi:GNAT superfamily N-acetyltransferase